MVMVMGSSRLHIEGKQHRKRAFKVDAKRSFPSGSCLKSILVLAAVDLQTLAQPYHTAEHF